MGIAMATSNSNQRKKQKKRRRTNISLKASGCRFFLFCLKKYMSVVMAMGNIGVFFSFFCPPIILSLQRKNKYFV